MGEATPSPMPREGRSDRAANGSPIPNLGQIVVHFRECRLAGVRNPPFKVAAVDAP